MHRTTYENEKRKRRRAEQRRTQHGKHHPSLECGSARSLMFTRFHGIYRKHEVHGVPTGVNKHSIPGQIGSKLSTNRLIPYGQRMMVISISQCLFKRMGRS